MLDLEDLDRGTNLGNIHGQFAQFCQRCAIRCAKHRTEVRHNGFRLSFQIHRNAGMVHFFQSLNGAGNRDKCIIEFGILPVYHIIIRYGTGILNLYRHLFPAAFCYRQLEILGIPLLGIHIAGLHRTGVENVITDIVLARLRNLAQVCYDGNIGGGQLVQIHTAAKQFQIHRKILIRYNDQIPICQRVFAIEDHRNVPDLHFRFRADHADHKQPDAQGNYQ